jgi:hypothetical protein
MEISTAASVREFMASHQATHFTIAFDEASPQPAGPKAHLKLWIGAPVLAVFIAYWIATLWYSVAGH